MTRLQAINEEARERGIQLSQQNIFLKSILTSLRGGVVMLDRDLPIQKPMQVKVTCTQLVNPDGGDAQGVILVMEETNGES